MRIKKNWIKFVLYSKKEPRIKSEILRPKYEYLVLYLNLDKLYNIILT